MHNVSSFVPFYRTFIFSAIEQNGSYIIHLSFTETKETSGQPLGSDAYDFQIFPAPWPISNFPATLCQFLINPNFGLPAFYDS